MFNFFAKDGSRQGNCFVIDGTDYNHIVNVLRKSVGDSFLVSSDGESHLCEIKEISTDAVIVDIIEENCNDTSLGIEIYLFQGLPKSDKMELIIQKSVELGVHKIIPVETANCVVKLDDKKKKSKIQRWQAISESAAKQSKRNTVPDVGDVLSFKQALLFAQELDLLLVPYECAEGMNAMKNALSLIKSGMRVGVMIGPEGGFSEKEIEDAVTGGGKIISLGKRILRTETASIIAVGALMLYAETENL